MLELFAEIDTRTKAAAVPAQQHNPNDRVCLDGVERGDQLIEHVVGQRVALLRTIQRNRRDALPEAGLNKWSGSRNGRHDASA
jgi:hypothetical protein